MNSNPTPHPIPSSKLLDFLREVVAFRALRGDYVPQEDNHEGYVATVLVALQQWCYASGLCWEHVLHHAEDLAEHDEKRLLGEAFPYFINVTLDDLECPRCRQNQGFMIEVSECQIMYANDGTVIGSDEGPQWGSGSYCRCLECSHTGIVNQFRKDKPERWSKPMKAYGEKNLCQKFMESAQGRECLDENRQMLKGRTITDVSFSNEGLFIATTLHLDDGSTFYLAQPSLDSRALREQFLEFVEEERAKEEPAKASEGGQP